MFECLLFCLTVATTFQNPIPTNKPGAEPKRPNRPVDITKISRLSNTVTNSMSVSWAVEENKVNLPKTPLNSL